MKQTLVCFDFFFFFLTLSDVAQQAFQCAYLRAHSGEREDAQKNIQVVEWTGNGKQLFEGAAQAQNLAFGCNYFFSVALY